MHTSPEPITVSSSVLEQMFLYLSSKKFDTDGFLRSLNIEPASVISPDARVPVETYLLIQDLAAEAIQDPYFGLHMGEYAEPGSWSILGYVMMNCKTLGEALEKSAKYERIIGNLIEARGDFRLNKVRVVYDTPSHAPKMSRHCFEASLSSTVSLARNLTGVHLCPLEVTFIYPKPESTVEYERIFGCPVRFEQSDNSMTLDIALGAMPVRMANPMLLEQFEKYAQDFLTTIERKDAFTQAVIKVILAQMDDETLSIQKVARQMSVSVRTLQNRLEAEGVVFSELMRNVRQRLAKKYLRENYSVEQITYLLGFSEPSVFRKAFKKWAGVTPREYRESAYLSNQL